MFLLYVLYHIFDEQKIKTSMFFLVYYLNHLLFKLALSVYLKIWKVHLKITLVLNVILDPKSQKYFIVMFYTISLKQTL